MKKYTGSNFVFLVGAPRSGTTWLQYLLASHPEIQSGRESYVFSKICLVHQEWHKTRKSGMGMASYQTAEEFMSNLFDFEERQLDALTKNLKPGQILLEKTPAHALYVPQIAWFLPEARFIHIMRDGRDVVASLMAAGNSWGEDWAPTSARRAARIWKRHVQAVDDAKTKLKPHQFLEVRYEALLEDTARELRRCIDFIGLPWPEEALRQAVAANTSEQMRAGNGKALTVSGELAKSTAKALPDGFVRKAKSGAWREDLSLAQRFQVWRVARKTLGKFGYAWPLFFL